MNGVFVKMLVEPMSVKYSRWVTVMSPFLPAWKTGLEERETNVEIWVGARTTVDFSAELFDAFGRAAPCFAFVWPFFFGMILGFSMGSSETSWTVHPHNAVQALPVQSLGSTRDSGWQGTIKFAEACKHLFG